MLVARALGHRAQSREIPFSGIDLLEQNDVGVDPREDGEERRVLLAPGLPHVLDVVRRDPDGRRAVVIGRTPDDRHRGQNRGDRRPSREPSDRHRRQV